MSSVAGRRALPTSAVYCGTKHAVHAISESLRSEVAGSKVRVVTIAPGLTETEFLELSGENGKGFADRIKNLSMGCLKSEDVANAILYSYEAPPHVCIREIVLAPTEQV